jgi:hypothetical protein
MSVRRVSDVLAVGFSCADTIRVGDIVELSAAKTVAVPAAAGSLKIVGTVVAHGLDATTCTVETRFREYRYGSKRRTAGGAIAAGSPLVVGTAGKIIAYVEATHSPAAIIGLAVTAAAADGDPVETLEY